MSNLLSALAWPLRVFSGLQRTLLLFVALPLIVVAALGIRLGFDQANKFQENLLKDDLELIGRAIRIPVGEAMAKGDREAVQLALESVFTIDRVYGASVFNLQGERMASGGIAERDLTRSVIPEKIMATEQKQEQYRQVDGHLVYSHFLPVFDRVGGMKGFIQITRRHDDFKDSIRQLTLISWTLWGLLTATIIMAVLIGHHGGIGRHVRYLLATMAEVEKGSPDQRATITGPREMAALASGLNRMLDSIQDSEQALEQHRQAEKQLLLQLKDNEKMATIGRMAGGFAHELGAPLSVIDGRAHRIKRSGMVTADGEKELDDIQRQVQHLTHTVKQLLEYSRPRPRSVRNFTLDSVLERAQSLLGSELDANNPKLDFLPHQQLGEIHGDPDRLLLALLNIIRNALQAARSHVCVAARITDHGVQLQISDDGPGLPQDSDYQQLIEPFFTTKPSGQGTGLGLSIAHNIITEQHGSLKLENRPEGGCLAVVELPSAAHLQQENNPR